jgi:hypothetical protein
MTEIHVRWSLQLHDNAYVLSMVGTPFPVTSILIYVQVEGLCPQRTILVSQGPGRCVIGEKVIIFARPTTTMPRSTICSVVIRADEIVLRQVNTNFCITL